MTADVCVLVLEIRGLLSPSNPLRRSRRSRLLPSRGGVTRRPFLPKGNSFTSTKKQNRSAFQTGFFLSLRKARNPSRLSHRLNGLLTFRYFQGRKSPFEILLFYLRSGSSLTSCAPLEAARKLVLERRR